MMGELSLSQDKHWKQTSHQLGEGRREIGGLSLVEGQKGALRSTVSCHRRRSQGQYVVHILSLATNRQGVLATTAPRTIVCLHHDLHSLILVR